MIVLGIETSCDETAASVVESGHNVKSNVISSQIEKHAKFGGVVPELAAREHLEAINPVVNLALEEAKVSFSDLNAIAVTYSPGLLTSLLIGVSYAKGLAAGLSIPFTGVNHFLAHIFAAFIDHPKLLNSSSTYPLVALVVSGGNTALTLIEEDGTFRILGSTLDDAAGEAFDKGAKILNLSYPGGPIIDQLSKHGDPQKFSFPRGLIGNTGSKPNPNNRLNFSFSGVKTSLLYHARGHQLNSVTKFPSLSETANQKPEQPQDKGIPFEVSDFFENPTNQTNSRPKSGHQNLFDTIASYQEAIVDTLVKKAFWAVDDLKAKTLIVCGGVACNNRLRKKIQEESNRRNLRLLIVPPHFCTDNAAMIAGLGYYSLLKNKGNDLSLDANPRLDEIESAPFAGHII